MTEVDNACSNLGVKKMDGENSVKTVDCLRGRLLAERLASRNAKEETEQLENKLMELENMVKQEVKSRNRAEKRLKLLFKKLESKNISHVSDGSEYSGLVDKSDISSPSSTNSLGTQDSKQNCKSEQGSENNLHQNNNLQKVIFSLSDDNSSTIEVSSSGSAGFKGQEYCEMGQIDLSDNFAQNFIVENFLFSEGDANSEKSDHLGFDQNCDDSKIDEQSDICYHRFRFSTEDGFNKEKDEDEDDVMSRMDESMALVVVDTLQKNRAIDPEVLDSAVKEVLDALKRAKEQLQSSMEKRRANMIREYERYRVLERKTGESPKTVMTGRYIHHKSWISGRQARARNKGKRHDLEAKKTWQRSAEGEVAVETPQPKLRGEKGKETGGKSNPKKATWQKKIKLCTKEWEELPKQ
ncbi:hypothetical protein PHJA_002234700 [Phtheirospermum japonicum]|uniref:Uncharacterized protein n=1 Tax=Phtheirospermum japonicum TaxID=374723 RepID=A0A830CJR8_9LAMI|nr:hypothetical protein PHJA_002234700 [Phtheirospermum japonicum]